MFRFLFYSAHSASFIKIWPPLEGGVCISFLGTWPKINVSELETEFQKLKGKKLNFNFIYMHDFFLLILTYLFIWYTNIHPTIFDTTCVSRIICMTHWHASVAWGIVYSWGICLSCNRHKKMRLMQIHYVNKRYIYIICIYIYIYIRYILCI